MLCLVEPGQAEMIVVTSQSEGTIHFFVSLECTPHLHFRLYKYIYILYFMLIACWLHFKPILVLNDYLYELCQLIMHVRNPLCTRWIRGDTKDAEAEALLSRERDASLVVYT